MCIWPRSWVCVFVMTFASGGAFAHDVDDVDNVGAKAHPDEGVGQREDVPAAKEPDAKDVVVDRFRTPVDRLTEHYLGSTSRPVRFDWRKSWFQLALNGGELIERNNFGSFRIGGVARKAFSSLMVEVGVSYVHVLGTEASRLLSLTPYLQSSRPRRIEIEANASWPLFEGVVTPLFDFIPPSEMVLSVTGGVRYLVYPQVIIGNRNWRSPATYTNFATYRDIGTSLGNVRLLEEDLAILERDAQPGMSVDPALFQAMSGLTFDLYYQPGLFFTVRALVAVPALSAVSGSRLGFFWETSLMAGWAF